MTPDTPNRWLENRSVSGDAYDATYERREAAGENVHGEADFVELFAPTSVLDAGCGTGRVGRELARRGMDVVGVDLDPAMLDTARQKAPGVDWRLADLATVDLGRSFDAIVMAGNVMIFLTPGSEAAVVANLARHLEPGGADLAGLALAERWSTWDRDDWDSTQNYAVSIHRKPPAVPVRPAVVVERATHG